MWLWKFRKLFVFNHISVAIYSIINCLIVFMVISVLRLLYLDLRWEKSYCIILPRVLYHFAPCMGQNDTADDTFWMLDLKHLCHFMPVFSFAQVVANTWQCIIFKSNKIYPVTKAGKKYFKKVDHFAPVSPTWRFDSWRLEISSSFQTI